MLALSDLGGSMLVIGLAVAGLVLLAWSLR
jgi:hypothetical protein